MMKMIKRLINKLLGRKTTPVDVSAPPPFTPPEPMPPAPVPPKEPTFVEDFSSGKLDPAKWTVSTWTAPGASSTHKGTFLAKNVTIVDGVLCLALTQSSTSYGIASKGAEIATVQQFGYGTYECVMRASSTSATSDGSGSPVSGSVTGFFNYAPAYITEIDFEMEGCSERSPITQLTSWVNENLPNEHTNVSASGLAPEQGFFTYKFVWMPGKIEFYRDNVLIGTHTKVVPTDPAAVMLNHWGTNNQDWGGVGSPGITRYMWVKSFKYTPL